ncbi:MAG: NUMOD4 motif-containing HNH endonuclease [Mycobacterium sp.]
MSEEWRALPGYEGIYAVSDQGRVQSLDRITDRGRKWKGRILSPATMPSGYRTVSLWRNGKQTTALVHRLVLFAFVGPCPEGMEALHKCGVPSDNRLVNLAWGTHSENQHDQVSHGTHTKASKRACPSGHPYDAANTYIYPGKGAHRACRKCRAANLRAWQAANPERAKELARNAQERYRAKQKAN